MTTLKPETQKLADRLFATGRYNSVDEAIQQALRDALIEDHTHPLTHDEFLAEIDKGIEEADRGELLPLPTVEELIAEANADAR